MFQVRLLCEVNIETNQENLVHSD